MGSRKEGSCRAMLARLVVALALLALCGSAAAFSLTLPVARMDLGRMACRRSPANTNPLSLRRASVGRLGLRMSDAPSTDSADDMKDKKEEEPSPSTVLSDDDLDARIAALGLKAGEQVKDRSTGEDLKASLSPLERVQKESVDLGKAAIGTAASGVISVLNTIEKPIDEEEWKKLQEEKAKGKTEVKKEEVGDDVISSGGIFVVIPVLLVGGALAYWAVASELNWF